MKKNIIKIIKFLCLVLVFGFIAKYLIENINDLKSTKVVINIAVFIASLAIYLVYKLYNALLWHFITVKAECSISLEKSIIGWSYSQLGKFIPGKVFYLLGRLYYYNKENVPATKVTFCFLLENAMTFLSALFVLLISLPFIKINGIDQYVFASIICIVLLFICIHPRIMEFGMNILLSIFKKQPVKLNFSYLDMLLMVVLFISNWLVMGVGFYILTTSLYPVNMNDFFYLTAAFALANVLGILAFFAPGGIGVREFIIVLVLKSIMPENMAVIVSIVSRVWYTLGEVMISLGAFVYERAKGIKNPKIWRLPK